MFGQVRFLKKEMLIEEGENTKRVILNPCICTLWIESNFFCIHPSQGLLPVLGPLERCMTPALDMALLSSSRAGADLGRTSVS